MEDCIKCELVGGGSPRYLNTFSNFLFYFYCWLYTAHIQYTLCIVAILDFTHVFHV